MTKEEEKIIADTPPILAAAKQKSLELLYDYTKFHIGVYLTLTASYLTAATASVGGHPLLSLNLWLAWPAIIAFIVAGLAGGIIVSSITQQVGCSSVEFLEKDIGLWDCEPTYYSGKIWTIIEHTSFWAGLIFAVISFI